jgi:hypothetical protein
MGRSPNARLRKTRKQADIAKVLTFDEARRIAVNVAKLPGLLRIERRMAMNRISILTTVCAVAMINVGCDDAPEKRRIAVIPASENIQSFAAYATAAKGADDECFPVPDDETESGLNLSCGGDNWILMWDENKDGGFVPGSAQQCCL